MLKINSLTQQIADRISVEALQPLLRPCRPRILVLTDSSLSFSDTSGFGLWRFLHAITLAPGVSPKPVLTLAYRTVHPGGTTVNVGPDSYTVVNNFNFATASPAVTVANYDQIWIFGFGSGAFSLGDAEVAVVSTFMNSGGGLFATGDHGALGQALCGSLPRVRHMREWRDPSAGGVPMGLEANAALAVLRNDTVVNPGAGGVYEFADQSDDIPQRIYPQYKVRDVDGLSGPAWEASVHPVLMLPGAPTLRRSSDASPASGFTLDMDVLPDHPHESQCYAVTSASVLGGSYTVGGQNFPEFPPSAADPTVRVGAEIVAWAVAGGRSVYNGGWKPPVTPHMFGVISAYDGRLTQPYPGMTQRPGRVLCDSTWHHFVNINLDGTSSGRNGLGSGAGLDFTPSPDLAKIYTYYRNVIRWLQPANRVLCRVFWDLAAVRVSSAFVEEMAGGMTKRSEWAGLVDLGRAAGQMLSQAYGPMELGEQVMSLLCSDRTLSPVADLLSSERRVRTTLSDEELIAGAYGALLEEMMRMVPDADDTQALVAALKAGPTDFHGRMGKQLLRALQLGVKHQAARAEQALAGLRKIAAVQ